MTMNIRRVIAGLMLFAVVFAVAGRFQAKADAPPVVKITAKRFAFTPNVITLKRGEPVTLQLNSEDVTHGFFMKALKIDEVIVPGKTTEIHLTPQTAGRYTTICDHFCGSGHGGMNMTIVVE
jgi:cytochrome c oxidase subunit II